MELKTGRKVLKRRGNVGILRLDKFFSKIYKSRITSIKKSLQHINNMLIYEHKIYSRSIKKECKIILNLENFFEKINF